MLHVLRNIRYLMRVVCCIKYRSNERKFTPLCMVFFITVYNSVVNYVSIPKTPK